MMNRIQHLCLLLILAAGLTASLAGIAPAQVYINEIYFNPPTTVDTPHEYIELRGTPSMSLAKHYLIFVSTLDNSFHTGSAGKIRQIFNLNSGSLGTNGFLTLRQRGNGYTVATGTTDLVNSGSGAGFGSGATSSIGASDVNANGIADGEIASNATAMLIRVDAGGVAPALSFDLDVGNNGLDVPTGRANWTILDSIGYTEPTVAYTGRFYGKINYGTELPDLDPMSLTYFDPSQHLEPGATYVGTGFESEYAARWGNSTGQTAGDWNIANLTDNAASGFQTGSSNYRQSGDPTPPDDGNINTPPPQPATIESTQGVPYGTIITNTLGAPNFLSGDYNKDGVVNAADYVAWRKRVGQTGSDLADNPADGDHNYLVGASDFTVFRAHFGQPPGSAPGSGAALDPSGTVPEPAGWLLAVLASLAAMPLRKRPGA